MNNRQRQIIKWQLYDMHAKPKYLGFIRGGSKRLRVVFISPEHVQDYKDVYGDNIEIWG